MNFRYKVNFKKEELGLLKVDGNQQYQRHDMTLAEEKNEKQKKTSESNLFSAYKIALFSLKPE